MENQTFQHIFFSFYPLHNGQPYRQTITVDSSSLTFIGKSNQILFGICHFHEACSE